MWPASGDDATLEIGYAALPSRAVVRTVTTGPADGPPVLLLHGWGCSAFLFRHNLPALGRAGFRATAVDLKGHGLSDKPEADGEYSLGALTVHVLEILDTLRLSSLALVGHSMGGRVAIEVARRSPSRIERLALIAPVGIGEFHPRALLTLAGWRVLEPLGVRVVTPAVVRLALSFVYGRRAQVTPATVAGYCAPMQYAEYPRILQRVLREFSWAPLLPRGLEAIEVPMLVVRGTRDSILRARRDNPLLAERAGVRVAWIDGAGHAPNEECPEEVNAILIDFLSDSGRPG